MIWAFGCGRSSGCYGSTALAASVGTPYARCRPVPSVVIDVLQLGRLRVAQIGALVYASAILGKKGPRSSREQQNEEPAKPLPALVGDWEKHADRQPARAEWTLNRGSFRGFFIALQNPFQHFDARGNVLFPMNLAEIHFDVAFASTSGGIDEFRKLSRARNSSGRLSARAAPSCVAIGCCPPDR